MTEKIDTQGMSGEATEGCTDNIYPRDENGEPIELVDGATLDILLTFDPSTSSRSTYDVGYITEDGEIIALGAECSIDDGSSYACEADGPGFGSYIVYSYDPSTAISGCTDSNACNSTEEATLP